jgi:pimeloyl-ACP methyl ester carboxylesterase
MVTYDLRGHGDSDKPSDPAFYRDPERWADEVEAVMDVCGLHRPVLVAWSLGGVVTTAYLQKYGTRRLAAVDWVAALAGFGPNMPPSAAFEVGARLASPHLHERIDALRSWLHSCFGKTPPPDVFERMLVNSSLSLPLATVVSPPMVGDWRPVLRAFDRPALISQGDADRITHMDIARGLVADIPNAELSVYEGGGHALFVDEPERFGGELLRLVDRSR